MLFVAWKHDEIELYFVKGTRVYLKFKYLHHLLSFMSELTVFQQKIKTGLKKKTILSSSETAVDLPSWWSYKVVAVSWEIPPAFLHLDPSPLMSTSKDGRQSLQQSSIMPAQILKSPTHSSCLGGFSVTCVSGCDCWGFILELLVTLASLLRC